MVSETHLDVVMYHYVRDLPRSRFPRIKGMLTSDFRRQVDGLRERYEMATLETALEFLAGRYQPRRDLCLLTFDDGLKEHYTDVLPVLAERRIQGLFFVVTGCLEDGRVVAVHKNHFLMAALSFDDNRAAFLARLSQLSPETDTCVEAAQATYAYRWDTVEVAKFKYLLNFRVPDTLRHQILDELFEDRFGDEREFARELYMSWSEAREAQSSGMLIGGHSHHHSALAKLDTACQQSDLETCTDLLHHRCRDQQLWPFSYPYGKPDESFNSVTVQALRDLGFICAFSTEVGSNSAGQDRTRIRRIDPKDVVL